MASEPRYNQDMAKTSLFDKAKRLSVPKRLDLIDRLIESVESESARTNGPRIRAELDRRYRAFEANPDEGEPWEVVRERIRRSLDATADRHRSTRSVA
jgi:putative addiction module component (TIGR02574 family)